MTLRIVLGFFKIKISMMEIILLLQLLLQTPHTHGIYLEQVPICASGNFFYWYLQGTSLYF